MSPNHHPRPETLLAHAAGTLPNAISCVVACHLSLCERCAGEVRWLEAVGGVLLGEVEAPPLEDRFFERAAARWTPDNLPPRRPPGEPTPRRPVDPWMPPPLARYLGLAGTDIPWKRVVKGVRQHWIRLPEGAGQMRLLRLTPGKLLLEHTHTGMELTMVLQGVYGDHTGDYVRGDVIEWTEGTLHQPYAAGEEECICLIASEHTPRFSRLIARLLRPILGF